MGDFPNWHAPCKGNLRGNDQPWIKECDSDMNVRRTNIAMATVLPALQEPATDMPERSERMVPEKPTTAMLASGSMAGGVSVETAWNIYQAMLKAAP